MQALEKKHLELDQLLTLIMHATALLVALAASASAGIYPDGHFDVATKLTKDNYQVGSGWAAPRAGVAAH